MSDGGHFVWNADEILADESGSDDSRSDGRLGPRRARNGE